MILGREITIVLASKTYYAIIPRICLHICNDKRVLIENHSVLMKLEQVVIINRTRFLCNFGNFREVKYNLVIYLKPFELRYWNEINKVELHNTKLTARYYLQV